MKIALISCIKSKRPRPCAAKGMYISPLFRKMMACAEGMTPDKIYILSAQYGLLSPDTVITPYEKTLGAMNKSARMSWARAVLRDLSHSCNLERDEFVFLAGSRYRENLVSSMNKVQVPMRGLSFGEQLQWLNAQI